MTHEVTVAGGPAGAAPVWDVTSDTLLWVERDGRAVHRFIPPTGQDAQPGQGSATGVDTAVEPGPTAGLDESLGLPQPVAAAHPRHRGGLVLTLRDGVALLEPDGTRRWLVYWARAGVTGAAAAVDQAGRLWVTTTGDGTLLRLDPDGALTVVRRGTDISDITFSPDADTIYLADAAAGQIIAADFDPDSGQVGATRPVCPVPGGVGALCADAEGCLWVTPGIGSAVHRYHPDGTPDRRLPLDATPTGCTFGGLRLCELYLTTALPQAGAAGPLLVITDAGAGLPTPVFAG